MTKTKQFEQEETIQSFAELFENSIKEEKKEGTIVKGKVVSVTNSDVIIDVGLKSEGRISIKEFTDDDGNTNIKVNDLIDVFIERLEDREGSTQLSREKALKEEAWYKFEDLHRQAAVVEGKIIGRVKGGFAVDIGKIIAFLPGSQVDIRPIKDINPLIGIAQPFKILKMDKYQGNVVVSRRAIIEESRAEARESLLANISENIVLEGSVKNITDYGAFVDLGPIDGLLHITDMSWNKISHPSEILTLGQQIKVLVIKYNEEAQRVSLGLKQLENNPWEGFADKYSIGQKFDAVITTVTDYGAFAELEPGVEGLVHYSEISWNVKNTHPRKLLKNGDKVEVMVTDIDISKHKISLSIKRCKQNPWEIFSKEHPVNSQVEGTITNIVDFGMFLMIGEEDSEIMVEALIPILELSWTNQPETELKQFKKGDLVKGVVLSVDIEKERITIGLKQLKEDNFAKTIKNFQLGDNVTGTVAEVKKEGIEVEIADNVRVFIKKTELSKHKSEQRPDRYGVGDKLDAKIISLEPAERKISLSIKALEVDEEKKAIDQYGSKDSGASLGEILGMALNKEKEKSE